MLMATPALKAQNYFDPMKDSGYMFDVTHILATLAVIFLISTFILSLVKLIFENRVKNRLIDKGASEDIVSKLLYPGQKDNRNLAIKWAVIFAGIGAGHYVILYCREFHCLLFSYAEI